MGNLGYGAYATHPGDVLKAEIEERGISQRQLAESMGLTYSVVNEWETRHLFAFRSKNCFIIGVSSPSFFAISFLFCCKVSYFS